MAKRAFEILYEDEHLIAVEKEADLLTIPDRFNPEKPSLLSFIRHYRPDEHIMTVHRLDRETSGVICFAKNPVAHQHLSLQFQHREVKKFYHALLEGNLPKDEGVIDEPIAPSTTKGGRMIVAPWGKPSTTFFKVIERFRNYTLVEAELITGRTHQVRVHFAATGYPLAVDAMYGNQSGFYLSAVKGRGYQIGKGQEELPLMSRVSLHAVSLMVKHPVSGESLTFEANYPKDFRAVITQLRKWASVDK